MAHLSGDLDRYTLGEQLGPAGGYGVPFRAVRDDGLRCVVKLIYGFQNPSPDVLDRLKVVLARLALVRSDHVVPIVDAGLDKGQIGGCLPWIAMPELPGARSLRDLVAADGPMSPLLVASIMTDLANGLADLHEVGILHRDLKPENVLIDAEGRAWLIDFELIKILDLATKTPRYAEPLGTDVYMAPEQFLGPVVPESDLWALGLILVELLTGCQPVAALARGRRDIKRAALAGPLVPPGLPEPWRQLASMLLRKLPAGRPGAAREVARWIEHPRRARSLAPEAVTGTPLYRWFVRSSVEVDAVELAAAHRLAVSAVDVDGPARTQVQRVRRATRQLGAALSLNAPPSALEQLSIEEVLEGEAGGDVERMVLSRLRVQRDSPGDVVVLPWQPVEEVGVEEAVHTLRVGLRYRHIVGDRPVLATVQCPLRTLTDRRRALEFGAALTALDPDGWRLFVDGLDPGCSTAAISATIDMASALASRADVWVRSNTLARWAIAAEPGVSVLYRAGRGLWTRSGGRAAMHAPERVESAALAGPVPRWVVERLAVARPDLLGCPCAACKGKVLPSPGADTVAHNLYVASLQFSVLVAQPDDRRRPFAIQCLLRARELRASLPSLVGWRGELGDVDAALRALAGNPRSPNRGKRLIEVA